MPRIRAAFACLALLGAAQPAAALFHLAVIDEVMTSYDGDFDVQFVEIKMNVASQTFVENSVLGIFDGSGNYERDALVVPGNLANGGAGVRWLMGTPAFEAASGIQVDFEFAPGLVAGSGMICWGAPGTLPPADPNSWDHTDPANYVDCVAYGGYSGPTNTYIGDPTPIEPDGHSLQRITESHDNLTDFACGDPANPTNNAGETADLAATIPCPEPSQILLLLAGAGALIPAQARAKRRR